MKIRPADTRGHIPQSWKGEDNYQSYRSFSCMSYQDEKYTNWGPVVTINDDRTKPGFVTTWHEHVGLDILNYMIKGHCRHLDDKGNDNVATVNQVQHFWCGPGMYHHLSNVGDTDNRYLQIWIMPNSIASEPFNYELIDRAPGFAPLPIKFKNSRIEVWAGNLDQAMLAKNSYILVLEGSCRVNGVEINEGDAVEIDEESLVQPNGTPHLLLFEMNW